MIGFTKCLVLLIHTIAISATSTSSLCNPLSTSSCPSEKALATDVAYQFTSESDDFEVTSIPSGISYSDNGVTMTIAKRYDNPTLMSKFYIMFGRVEVSMKAGNGTGIVSSFYLQSNDLDEIDIELIGGDSTQWQSNYFVKGDTTTYDRGEFHDTSAPPQNDYHNYTIDWTNEKIVWYYDGSAVRTLKNDSSQGFPQSPMYLKFGIWAGGDPSNEAGTIEWAGGETDYSQVPFSMHINHLEVSDYSTGDSYSYTDQSGDWSSIEADNGKVLGRQNSANLNPSVGDTEDSDSTSSTASKTSSQSASKTSKATSTKTSSKSSTEVSSTEMSFTEVSSKVSSEEASSTDSQSSAEISTVVSESSASAETSLATDSETLSDSSRSSV
ncbi:transglycosylase [Yamadazyma tenuis]|uniref:transglycosylase n=1 Tax=Candida tenuis TaxID=2315449 RepID=UPI0027AB8BB9|nr:transglycosylase [Yamadazyma tenuis]